VALASALLGNFLFMEPRYVLFAKVGDTVGTLIFLTSCSLIVLLVDTVRRAALEVQLGLQREARLVADLKHLNAELQHRVKNTLSVVQGLATQTFRHSPGDDESVRIFCGRLHALGQAHAVLTAGQWEMCQLPDLALRALAPFNGHSAISIEGPACKVPQQSCVPLVLALHELATNAVKYGALSTLDGIVDVRWAVQPGQGPEADQELVLDWTERGGPPVAPPSRRGLGSKLVARQHGIAAADLDFRPEGVACRLVSPGVILEPEEPN
jgi:two-component sensor histidine kinase